jgi:hypothetical protein
MNISAPFIQRPIATTLLMVGLLACGPVAYPLLPVAALPNVNYPTLTVTTQMPGADPQTMASTVASPLELQFGQIPGLTQMTSASALGYSQITLQFELSRGIACCALCAAACSAARPCRIVTCVPGCSLYCPSTTICSLAVSPESIRACQSLICATVIGRISTVLSGSMT